MENKNGPCYDGIVFDNTVRAVWWAMWKSGLGALEALSEVTALRENTGEHGDE